jgi:hypothetical protein
MPFELFQDAVVTLAALSAAAVVVRRVLGLVRPAAKPGCTGCPSAPGACGTAPPRDGAAAVENGHPLVLIRPSRPDR